MPAPPVGKYPEHWAECVQETDPAPPVLPAGIDPRAVDPAATNPLLGLTYFVDRMEPAYMSWSRWKRAGEDAKRARSGSSRASRASAGSASSRARTCRRRCAGSSTACSATSPAPCR